MASPWEADSDSFQQLLAEVLSDGEEISSIACSLGEAGLAIPAAQGGPGNVSPPPQDFAQSLQPAASLSEQGQQRPAPWLGAEAQHSGIAPGIAPQQPAPEASARTRHSSLQKSGSRRNRPSQRKPTVSAHRTGMSPMV